MPVSEDNVSRGKWPLAIVTEVHPGRDGLVRTATVETKTSVLNRPVQRLHSLEIASATPCVNSKNPFDQTAEDYAGPFTTVQRREMRRQKR